VILNNFYTKLIAACAAAFITVFLINKFVFEPRDFDECITKKMSGIESTAVGRAIYDSCRSRFPKETTNQ